MRWNVVFGMIVAAGSLTATAVRAQDNAAGTAAPVAQAATADGDEIAAPNQPATSGADGVPVPKPNPMSDFLEEARKDGAAPVEMPLVDDYRTDAPANGGQTK
jgi:hypothetical protein